MPSETVAILSNKGGVGKTHLATNMALSLAERGLQVLVVDADWSSASVTRKLGLSPMKTWTQYFQGEAHINDLIQRAPYHHNLYVLPGTTGELRVANMDDAQKNRMLMTLRNLATHARGDIIFFDLGAGIDARTLDTALAADRILLITTPQDVLHGYGCLKALLHRYLELCEDSPDWFVRRHFKPMVAVNMVLEPGQGHTVVRTMRHLLQEYARERALADKAPFGTPDYPQRRGVWGEPRPDLPLDAWCDVLFVGEIPYVRERFILAELNKTPFIRAFPTDRATQAIRELGAAVAAHPLTGTHRDTPPPTGGFWDRLALLMGGQERPVPR